MPLALASVLNSASQLSKLPPHAAALAADTVAITKPPATSELNKPRKFIVSPPRKSSRMKRLPGQMNVAANHGQNKASLPHEDPVPDAVQHLLVDAPQSPERHEA